MRIDHVSRPLRKTGTDRNLRSWRVDSENAILQNKAKEEEE